MSSTEKDGKLHSEIKLLDQLSYNPYAKDRHEHEVNPDDVLKIINDAKKEFDAIEPSLKEEWFAERDSEFRSKVMTWFDKWFGASL